MVDVRVEREEQRLECEAVAARDTRAAWEAEAWAHEEKVRA